MKVLRNRSTKENRDYWDHVEKVAAEVHAEMEREPWKRVWYEHMFCNLDGDGQCCRGCKGETCSQYVERTNG